MPTQADVRRIALALPEVNEAPHFDKTSFRVGAKIFCTMGQTDRPIVLKLDPEDRRNLAEADPEHVTAIPGYWGRNGWAEVLIDGIDPPRLEDLLRMAWAQVAPKRLAKALSAGA